MWRWVSKLKQFVHSITERLFSREAVKTVERINTTLTENKISNLTDGLLDESLSLSQWQNGMRQALKDGLIQQYLLGIGGKGQLSRLDYGSIGGMLADQLRYLDGFAAEIARGELTPERIRYRAEMYARSTREAFGRAYGRMWGVPEGALPAYPGDGNSRCMTNCQCMWEIESVEDKTGLLGWNCFWTLGAAEHCPDCIENSQKWAPLYIPELKLAGEEVVQ